MNYANIISDFTWSYSRITQFELCPYAFLLNYIKGVPRKRQFFSDYGSFMHKVIEMHLKGELSTSELVPYYLLHFKSEIEGKAPDSNIFKTYFENGYDYFSHIQFPYNLPVAIEEKVDFDIDGIPFTGVIDCVAEVDEGIIILDNKSRVLKSRSTRKKATKTDLELDAFLRQLYLYSIHIKNKYNTYPKRLEFNCFRTGQLISEPFEEEKLEETKQWALNQINVITNNEDWSPKMDYWKCRYICDLSDSCCYFQMNKS